MRNFKYHSTAMLKSILDKAELNHKESRMARSILITRFMEYNGVNSLYMKDQEADSCFSNSGCDCCSLGLGNNIYEVVGFAPRSHEVVDVGEICDECLEIHYNGVD